MPAACFTMRSHILIPNMIREKVFDVYVIKKNKNRIISLFVFHSFSGSTVSTKRHQRAADAPPLYAKQ